MALVASTIPNLISGVSQQPAPSRLRTSGDEMVNAFPSVVKGLKKRPPSEFVAEIVSGGSVSSSATVHFIERSATEKYILLCDAGELYLFDDQGFQMTLTFPDGKGYLPTTDMWKKLRFVTVADTTFILNTEKTVATQAVSETRTDPTTRASVFVQNTQENIYHNIYVNNILVASVLNGRYAAGTNVEDTTLIAGRLATDLIANGYTDATSAGSLVTFGVTSGDIVELGDGLGSRSMVAYTDELQSFDKLPPTEAEGRLVKIVGSAESSADPYWVTYSKNVWTETVGYNEKIALDPSTMPHVLVKTGVDTFEFRENTWEERLVGDSDTNPVPSFVGSTINSLFLFKGRMGFLSEENVVMSNVANFENLFRSTVIQIEADDVIDVATATGRVNTLHHGVSFSDELVIFSDKQQFRLSSGQILSADTVGITNSTAYACSTTVAPAAVGGSAFFIADGATHTIARELFLDANRQTFDADDIAVQIPSYIPKNIRSLAASTSADAFTLLPFTEGNALYLYKWYETDGKKIQSAWGKWQFGDETYIIGQGFFDDYLYIVYKIGLDVRVDRILVGPDAEKPLLIDHQFPQTSLVSRTYSSGTDLTTVVIPCDYPGTFEFYRTDDDSYAPYEGVTKVNDTTYTFPGDITSHQFVGGINYEFLYRFSTQYLREENSAGEAAIQDGRLQLRYMSLIYTDSSYFEAHVAQTNGTPDVYYFNGRTMSDPDNVTDEIPKDTGEFKFPIFAENEQVTIEVKSSQPYEVALGAVEWSANYRSKARRV
jgi:hypothetical protein